MLVEAQYSAFPPTPPAPSPPPSPCHGDEQRAWHRKVGVQFWESEQQSHRHPGRHVHRRSGWFGEKWTCSAGQGSAQKDSTVTSSVDWKEVLSAGERHLPLLRRGLHTNLSSGGSKAHSGVETCVHIRLTGEYSLKWRPFSWSCYCWYCFCLFVFWYWKKINPRLNLDLRNQQKSFDDQHGIAHVCVMFVRKISMCGITVLARI